LASFDPARNEADRKLANYLAGREIPDGEIEELVAIAKANKDPLNLAASTLHDQLRKENRTYSTAVQSPNHARVQFNASDRTLL
jgi:hypothetical protein